MITESVKQSDDPVIALQGSMIGREDKNGPQGSGVSEDVSFTLTSADRHAVCYGISAYGSNAMKSDNPHSGVYEADTSRTLDTSGGNPACNQGGVVVVEPKDVVVFESHDQDAQYRDLGEVSETVSAKYGTGGGNQPIVVSIGNGQTNEAEHPQEDLARALNCMHDQQAICVQSDFGTNDEVIISSGDGETYGLDRASYNQGKNALYDFSIESEKIGCQTAKGPGAVCSHYIVRRLTPLEAERLQGLPDRWTDIGDWVDEKGKTHKCSDAARYKAIGNGIAVPPWLWVLSRLNQFCEDKTMASLFDGVGTFPMIWSFLNGKENCVWSSEIEPFPIAVSKYHFPDEDDTDGTEISRE